MFDRKLLWLIGAIIVLLVAVMAIAFLGGGNVSETTPSLEGGFSEQIEETTSISKTKTVSPSIEEQLDSLVEKHKKELKNTWSNLKSNHIASDWSGSLVYEVAIDDNNKTVIRIRTPLCSDSDDAFYLGPVIMRTQTDHGFENFELVGGGGGKYALVCEAYPIGQKVKSVINIFYYKGEIPPKNIKKIIGG